MLKALRDKLKRQATKESQLDRHRALGAERQVIHREMEKEADKLRIKSPDAGRRMTRIGRLSDVDKKLAEAQRWAWKDIASSMERARQWEREGKVEKAIPVYEALIADRFDGTMPYDRLRIIYTRQKRFEDAIRVCEAYLALPSRPVGQNKPHFKRHRSKLKTRLAKQRGGVTCGRGNDCLQTVRN